MLWRQLNRRILLHAGFVLAMAVVLYSLIRYYFGNINQADSRETYSTILYFFVCVYAGRWVCRTFFLKNRFIAFSVLTPLAFAVLLAGAKLILNSLLSLNQKNIDEFFFTITPLFILGMLIGIFAPMIRSVMARQVAGVRKMAEQKQAELSLLQSQLSPHFLFNTLNNLYGISISEHEKIPGLLLKLSELLRYTVYETAHPFIPLSEEIKYISNYIAFERIRIGERLCLKTTIEETMGDQPRIAPMILIIFIENAFKHSKNSLDKNIYIDISLNTQGQEIWFTISNSHGYPDETGNSSNGGIGLPNAKKRLELLYAGEYVLTEKSFADHYTVNLRLKAK